MTAEHATPSSAGSADAAWFYRTDEGKSGPVSLTTLCDRIASGALSEETPVWRHGQGSWLPAVAFVELREAVAANRAAEASRAGARSGAPGASMLAVVGLVAVLLAWRLLASLWGTMAVAHVTGTVSAASLPVTGGSLILSPIAEGTNDAPGRPGVAAITPDGRFAMQIPPGSRGLAKRFTVRFSPPVLPPMSEAEATTAKPPYSGFVPKTREVPLHAGTNMLDVEIVPASRD